MSTENTILFNERTTDPDTPASGKRAVYTKSDGLYEKNSAGTVTNTSTGGGGSVTEANIQNSSFTYVLATGAVDTFAVAYTPTVTAYVTGQLFHFKANTVNTGAATLNVDSLGAQAILKHHDQVLDNGDIEAGQFVTVMYDGTNFQMQSQLGNAPSGGGSAPEYVTFSFSPAQNTVGGSATANAWTARPYDTEDSDDTGAASLSTNQFTLPAGTYSFELLGTHRNAPTGAHERLYNITDAAEVYRSPSIATSGVDVLTIITTVGHFTIASAKVFEHQYFRENAANTNDLGEPINNATLGNERYAVAMFTKVS